MAKLLLSYKNRGIDHASGLRVRGENIHLVVGGRELRALRLLDRRDEGEVVMAPGDEGVMAAALPNGPPLEGASPDYDEALRLAESSLRECSESQDDGVVRLAMLCKIEALLTLDLGFGYEAVAAPGLLRDLVRASLWRKGILKGERGRDADASPLLAWLNDCSLLCGQGDVGWLASRLRHLLDHGPGDAAATEHCQMALTILFAHVKETMEPLFLYHSKLVDCIAPPAGEAPERGLWLFHAGTGRPDGSIVRKLPVDALSLIHISEPTRPY